MLNNKYKKYLPSSNCEARARRKLIFYVIVAVVTPLVAFTTSTVFALSNETHLIKSTDFPIRISGNKSVPVKHIAPNWQQHAQRTVSESEYYISWQKHTRLPGNSPAHQAVNRAYDLRVYFTRDEVVFVPRITVASEWQWAMQIMGVGSKADIKPIRKTRIQTHRNRINYIHSLHEDSNAKASQPGISAGQPGQIVQWYINDEEGVEQGFTINQPLNKDGNIVVRMGLMGNLIPKLHGTSRVSLSTTKGVRVLEYGSLKAFDAKGRDLPILLALNDNTLDLVVNTTGAHYPVTIDPLITSTWQVEGNQRDALFGWSVASAGDVNGDGFSDVIVGAPQFDNGEISEGRVFVFHGSSDGLATLADWTAESNQHQAKFGYAVATAGDVNGDGYSDVIIGAPWFDNGQGYEGEGNEGRAYVYYGGTNGLNSTPAWTAESNRLNAFFGVAVATAGDVNGDGYSDVIIGAYGYHNDENPDDQINDDHPYEGGVFVYHGSDNGLAVDAAWIMEGNQADLRLGSVVASAGDVKGDGFSAVIIGVPHFSNGQNNEGGAYVFYGGASGLNNEWLNNTDSYWFMESNLVSAGFGRSVSSAGDVNADGLSDIIIGAPFHANNRGAAYVYLGGSDGVGNTALTWNPVDINTNSNFGFSVSAAGDMNGDGFSDVVVSAPNNNNATNAGRAFVYIGHEIANSEEEFNSFSAFDVQSIQAGALFGFSISLAGDVNGDGYNDLVIGSPYFDNEAADEGQINLIFGGDSDGDGLLDAFEQINCTNELDIDTDDDGLSDYDEDNNSNGVVDTGETDPCILDTDNDGIQDGTEKGITIGLTIIDSNPATLLDATNNEVFIPDHDPSTTTDPINPDTDNDGLMDGEEDLNANGLLEEEEGETNPNDPPLFETVTQKGETQAQEDDSGGGNSLVLLLFALVMQLLKALPIVSKNLVKHIRNFSNLQT